MAHRKQISRKRNPQIDYVETSHLADLINNSLKKWGENIKVTLLFLKKGIPDTCTWLSIFMGRFLLNSAEVEQNFCEAKKIGVKLTRNSIFSNYFHDSSFSILGKFQFTQQSLERPLMLLVWFCLTFYHFLSPLYLLSTSEQESYSFEISFQRVLTTKRVNNCQRKQFFYDKLLSPNALSIAPVKAN